MIRLTPGVAYSPEYLAKVEASQARLAKLIGGWQGPEHDAERAEIQAEQRRQEKRDARHAAGKLNESEHQRLVVKWLRARGHRCFSVPNGAVLGGSKYAQLGKLKAEGMSNGVPDLIISPPVGDRVCTALEMKSLTGKVSGEQQEWLDELERWGWRVLVAWGHEQAIKRLREAGY